MSKLYDDVKKHGEQIDDLQKTVTNHGTLKKVMEQLPGSLSKGVADVLSGNLSNKVKDALHKGFRREFADERKKSSMTW